MQELTNFSELAWGAEIHLPSSRKLANSPHFVGGRYPCRSVAYVPRMILTEFSEHRKNLTVLDPFMGSGTTAIEAIKYSSMVYGVEVDPYARLIASAATTTYTVSDIEKLRAVLRCVLDEGPKLDIQDRYRPNLTNITYWFHKENFDDLIRLRQAIVYFSDAQKTENLFLAALGDIVRACSKAERQSLKPYISKKYVKTPKAVFPEFERIAQKYIDAISIFEKKQCEGITWVGSDATCFVTPESVDIAITSPPYINAMDYTRCIKLESAWIGTADDTSIKDVRSRQLGESVRRHSVSVREFVKDVSDAHFPALKNLDEIRYETVLAFFDDMIGNLESVFNSLKPGGEYFIIIGNSTIRGVEVPTHEILATLAQRVGFDWAHYFFYQIRDHRTSIPRGDRGGKIEVEHVIGLRKVQGNRT